MKLKFFLLLISSQIAIISILLINLYEKRSGVLGEKSVNVLYKKDLIFPEGELKYFYEYKPSSKMHPKNYWFHDEVEYTINSDSLNERYEYSTEKPAGVFRIITLGDSYTFGLYVNTFENYPEKLEDLLNSNLHCKDIKKFEVINLGMAGYDIQYSVERFKRRGGKYSPDLVIWLLKNDDFQEITDVMKPKADSYKKQMEESGELEERYKEGDLSPYWNKVRKEFNKQYPKEKLLEFQKLNLESINKYYNKDLLFLTFPSIKEEDKSILESLVSLNRKNHLYAELTTNGENFLDKHPTSKGYTFISNDVFKYLINNKVIACD